MYEASLQCHEYWLRAQVMVAVETKIVAENRWHFRKCVLIFQ